MRKSARALSCVGFCFPSVSLTWPIFLLAVICFGVSVWVSHPGGGGKTRVNGGKLLSTHAQEIICFWTSMNLKHFFKGSLLFYCFTRTKKYKTFCFKILTLTFVFFIFFWV